MTSEIEQALSALRAYFKDNHDVVDVGGGDRPGQGPNWAMQCSQLLEEIEELMPERSALLVDGDWLRRKLASGADDGECEARPARLAKEASK